MEMPDPDDLFAERYRIEKILGQGGFATVYLARDESASRPVALKVLRPDKEGKYLAEIESRFEREVSVIAQLTDVHTVTLFDWGREDGLLYMVCEYVPGEDLSQVIVRENTLHPKIVMHIMEQVLESLAEAHKRGLLHRDIKPENIRIYEYDGDPYCAKLLDFGIARPADQAPQAALTQDGELLGTPRYMAPEQLMEEEMSPATDIYSLGLVALEMLLGPTALAPNRWSDQFDRLITGHVFSIGAYEQIGPSLRALIQKMTAREADERYQSAEAVLRALAMVTQHDSEPSEDIVAPVSSAPPTLKEPPPRGHSGPSMAVPAPPEPKNNRTLLITAVVLVCAVIGVGAFAWTQLSAEDEIPPPPQLEREPAAAALFKSDASVDETPTAELANVDAGHVDDAQTPSACGRPLQFRGTGQLIHRDGLTQSMWTVHIPQNYDVAKRHPLVVLLHRDAQSSDEVLALTRFGEHADQHGFVVVAPDDAKGGMYSWRVAERDVPVVQAAVEDVQAELCIDEQRIFVVSHGSGGHVVEAISCLPWVRAVATNGFRTERAEFACDRAVPSLHLAPMNSRRMPLKGGKDCFIAAEPLSFDLHNDKWIARNGCKSRRLSERREDGRCYRYDCETPYEVCELDAGYGWPGSGVSPPDPLGGCADVVPKFPATEMIWAFFERVSG